MRILITGGTGYVGRALTRSLLDHHEVVVVDSLRYGESRFDKIEQARVRLVRQDIRDYAGLAAVFREVAPDLVVHLAAIHYIPECERLPDQTIAVNTLGTSNVCRACAEGTALVFTSTAAVYAPCEAAHVEGVTPVGPTDVYGLSKRHAEDYVRYWARERHLRAAIVRLFNVIGPGETNPHILPAIIAQLLAGARTLQLGNCHPRRDYVDVADVAAGLQAVAFGLPAAPGVDVVNLGTGLCHSVHDLVTQLGPIVGRDLAIASDPARVRATDRPVLRADITHITNDYGWTPALSIDDSLRRLWMNPDVPAELLARS